MTIDDRDEMLLRRALRLDAAERVRFDPALIAAEAAERDRERLARVLLVGATASGLVPAIAAVRAVGAVAADPTVALDPLALLVTALMPFADALTIAMQPGVPVALFCAVALFVFFERREGARVEAS